MQGNEGLIGRRKSHSRRNATAAPFSAALSYIAAARNGAVKPSFCPHSGKDTCAGTHIAGYDVPIQYHDSGIAAHPSTSNQEANMQSEARDISIRTNGLSGDCVILNRTPRGAPKTPSHCIEGGEEPNHHPCPEMPDDSGERFRIFAEQSSDVLLTLDLDLCFNYVSPAVYRHLGFRPEELIARPVDFILAAHSSETAHEVFHDAMKIIGADGTCQEFISRVVEIECRKSDGEGLWMEVKLSFLRDSQDRPTGIIGIARDIGDRMEIERLRQQAFIQIERNMEQLATLNDHIRNPLQVILALAELDGNSFSGDIVKQVCEIDTIINRLDHGYLESEKIRDFLRKHRPPLVGRI